MSWCFAQFTVTDVATDMPRRRDWGIVDWNWAVTRPGKQDKQDKREGTCKGKELEEEEGGGS